MNSLAIKQMQMTIDSREVAQMLEKDHSYLLREIEGSKKGRTVGIIPTLEKANFAVSDYFIESSYKASGNNKSYKCYLITKLGCEMLGNKQQGEKGILFTAKYVKRFNELEGQLKPQLPNTYKEALQHLLVEVEKNELLEAENNKMKPKATYYDVLVESDHLTNIRNTAKEFGIKETDFIDWLIEKKFLYRGPSKRNRKGKLQPYSEYTGKYFEVKDTKNDKGWTGTQTLVTVEGKEYFRKRLIKENLLQEVC